MTWSKVSLAPESLAIFAASTQASSLQVEKSVGQSICVYDAMIPPRTYLDNQYKFRIIGYNIKSDRLFRYDINSYNQTSLNNKQTDRTSTLEQ